MWGDARLECGSAEPEVAFSAEADARTMGSKIALAVRAVNDDTVPVDITLATPYGTKTFAQVQPGKSAYQSFNTRSTSIPAGEVTVTGTKTVEGQEVTTERTVAYEGR